MKRIITLAGVTIPGATNMPSIQRSESGLAFGGIEDWSILHDPASVSEGRINNLARRGQRAANVGAAPDLGTIAGQPALAFGGSARPYFGVVDINPTAWTVWAVVGQTQALAGQIVAPNNAAAVGQHFLRITFNAGLTEVRVTTEGGAVRLAYAKAFLNTVSFLMFTFSVRDGLRIFDGGQLVAAAPNNVAPLTGQFGAGQWRWWEAYRNGQAGVHGLLSVDLGQPERAAQRRAIERFIMPKYGIAA